MSFEGDIYNVLSGLVSGRIERDTAPDAPVYPFITFQQVGGRAAWFIDQSRPGKKHARLQFNVWATTRDEANTIARQVEAALAASGFSVEPYGALEAIYSPEIKKYGTRQDFGVWYPDP